MVKNLALLADVAEVPSAYDAEALVSVLTGHLIQAGIPEPNFTRMMLDVIDELRRRDDDHSYPALRTLAVIGPPGVTEYAAATANRLAARDAAPPWIDSIGDVTAGTCHLAANAAGDTTLVSCEFIYADGSKPHAVWAVLDAAWHGVPACLMLADDLPEARARLAGNAKIAGAEVCEVPAAEAAPLVLTAIDALIQHGPPPEHGRKDESFSMACSSLSIARHRAELLLGPDDKLPARDPVEDHWPAAARDQLAGEFLASPHARQFPDMASRAVPRLLISSSIDTLGCDPTVASPTGLGRILLYAIPLSLASPDRYGDLIPPVARAWMEWLMDRRALDKPARRQIKRQLEATLRPRGRSGNELLDGGTDGCVGCRGPLIQAEQRRLMLGGGESDQGIVGGSAEDLASSNGGEKLLVTSLRQGEEWLGEAFGDEGVHDRRLGPVRWRKPGEHGVGLHRRVRDQPRPTAHSLACECVMLMPCGEGRDYHAGIDSPHRRTRSSVSRTMSAVSTGMSASATAATPSPSSTRRIGVAAGTISSRPSRSSISSG